MSGDKLFIDTNIAIYLLSGDETLAILLNDKNLYISFVTQLELLGFNNLIKKEEKMIQSFIDQCTVIDINSRIKDKVIELRKAYKIKLPDSIIIASSLYLDIPVITADKGFKKVEELNLLYYEKTD